jgi:hypothetical protein
MVFDKPLASQSDVSLACQIPRTDGVEEVDVSIMGDVLSEMLWKTLREKSAVTYGAYAYTRNYKVPISTLYMNSLVQNDATGFAVQTMLDVVAVAAEGKVAEEALLTAKWTKARRYVLDQQSGGQMLRRLMSVDVGEFNKFEEYAINLGNVSVARFPGILSQCAGQEIVTIVGPKEHAVSQLTERGIPHEVVDWEAKYVAMLDKKELKKYNKRKAKEAKEKESKK